MRIQCGQGTACKKTRQGEGKTTHLLVTLKEDDTTALVAGCEIITRVIKLNGRDNVGCLCKLTLTRGREEPMGYVQVLRLLAPDSLSQR